MKNKLTFLRDLHRTYKINRRLTHKLGANGHACLTTTVIAQFCKTKHVRTSPFQE